MEIQELTTKLNQVCDTYTARFGIEKSDDWFVMKIQEELGELSSAWLRLSARARIQTSNRDELEKNFRDEIADVIAMTMLFASHRGIDVESAIREKWFQYLPKQN